MKWEGKEERTHSHNRCAESFQYRRFTFFSTSKSIFYFASLLVDPLIPFLISLLHTYGTGTANATTLQSNQSSGSSANRPQKEQQKSGDTFSSLRCAVLEKSTMSQ